MATNPQLTVDMTLPEFEEQVDYFFKIIEAAKLPTSRDKVREDMLRRFAALNSMSETDAEAKLQATVAAPPPPPVAEPTPEPTKPRRRRTKEEKAKGATYFWVDPKHAAFMEMWMNLRKGQGNVANLLITGPSGCGKTEGIKRAGERFGMPVYKVDCASITTADKWLGHKEVDAEGTHYILSEHLRWLGAIDCAPGIVLYDEINRLHPSLLNLLIPVLDGSQSIWVPELGTTIQVHPDTLIAATANIGAGFSGTYKMDDALSYRFGYRLEQDFPPVAEEVKILTERTDIEQDKAKLLVDIANQSRNKVKVSKDLDAPITTRNLLETAELVAMGMTIQEAAEFTYVKFYSEEEGANSQRVMVRQITAGKAAGK